MTRDPRHETSAPPAARDLLPLAGCAVLYAAAIVAGRATRVDPSQFALVWPAAGVATVWLLSTRGGATRALALVVLGAVTVAANALTGVEPTASLLFGAVNVGHAVAAVAALRLLGWTRPRPPSGVRDVGVLMAASVAGAVVSGVLGGLTAAWRLGGELLDGAWLLNRNAVSTFVVAAVLLSLPALRSRDARLRGAAGWPERLVHAVGTLALTAVVTTLDGMPVAFLLVPAVVVLAVRAGAGWTAVVVGLQNVLVVVETVAGRGPFAQVDDPATRILLAQTLMAVLVLVGLCLALAEQERDTALAASRADRDRLHDHFQAALVGHATLAVEGESVVVLSANPAMHGLLRRAGGELVGADWLPLLHEADRAAVSAALCDVVHGRAPGWQGELRLGGLAEDVWVDATVAPVVGADGQASRLSAQLLDITGRKRAEQRLEHLVLHDELTGLPNRVLWRDQVERALVAAAATAERVGVLYVDLDRFKQVNDTHGHEVGDVLLVEVAHRLRGAVRPGDVVARLGGDEFVVLCPSVDSERVVEDLGRRLLAALAPPIEVDGSRVEVTASVGVTVSGTGSSDVQRLLRQADRAMYAAKKGGRARTAAFSAAVHAAGDPSAGLVDELRAALVRDELELHYQPVVEMASGLTTGVEALVRWRHPQRGLLLPGEWLDVMESTDLIHRLGELVLARAVADAALLREQGHPLTVHVNVSARELERPGLLDRVRRALATSGLPAHQLTLEITETRLLSISATLLEELEALRALGVQLAVDDFGTGFSALAHLVDLPIDVLKLDRTFVAGLGQHRSAQAVTAGVIAIARGLGVGCVAEGVEHPLQAATLQSLGYSTAQGLLYGRAVPLEELQAQLRRRAEREAAGRVPGPRAPGSESLA